MNDAQKLKFDYGIFMKKRDSVLPILGVWGLVLDANSFLEGPATCWNTFYALKRPATMISVFQIS